MRRFCILLVIVIFVSSWSKASNRSDDSRYIINGSVGNIADNGKMVYLIKANTGLRLDTAIVSDGKFIFTGNYKSPAMFDIVMNQSSLRVFEILAEDAVVTVKLTENPVVTSKGLNGEVAKIKDIELRSMKIGEYLLGKYLQEEALEIFTNVLHHNIIDPSAKLSPEDRLMVEEYLDEVLKAKKIREDILESNRDNILGVYCIQCIYEFYGDLPPGLSFNVVDSLLNRVPLARKYAPVMKMYDDFKAIEETSVGGPFLDFAAQKSDGSSIKLSDFVGNGKYVLVNFMAPWCGYCKQELPNLKYVYERYPDLIVLGVYIDGTRESFNTYIKGVDIPYKLLYAGDSKRASSLYGISSLPLTILFNPDGIIVDRGIDKENVKDKIADIFSK